MKIKEVELKLGMDRATIYFYEKEGLFNPSRTENGYRDYREEDLVILKRIKLLRSLHIPVEDIKALIGEKADLKEILSHQINYLNQEEENISYAKEVCQRIYNEEVTFNNLEPEKYSNQINVMTQERGSSYFKIQEELPQVFDPMRRFFARFIDIIFYTLIWNFILSSFKINILSRTLLETMVDGVVIVLMMLFLEPLFIRTVKTTLGKAIFGMNVEDSEGGKLTLEQSYNRTWGVLSKGLGFGIPLINLITLSVSYDRCKRGEVQPWDENISYKIKDYKNYRYFTMAIIVLIIILIEIPLSLNYFSPLIVVT